MVYRGISMAVLLSGAAAALNNRIFGAGQIERYIKQAYKGRDYRRRAQTSIATGNRHGGPHLHQREIARRLQQEARHVA